MSYYAIACAATFRLLGVPREAVVSISILYLNVPQCALNLFCTSHSEFGCGDPGTPTNGQRTVSGSSTTYYFVTYTCDEGYTRQGSNMRICLSNGQWSGGVPQCNGMLLKHQL